MQNEITTNDDLLDDRGRLKERGFSKKPLLNYNPEKIAVYPFKALNRLRLKEWDYYGITTSDFFFSATVSNLGYAGMVFIYYVDFHDQTCVERSIITPWGKDCILPHSSESGNIEFKGEGVRVSFLRRSDHREIMVAWKDFYQGSEITADLTVYQPDRIESIVMSTPIGRKRFYYNQKINCMPTEGTIRLGKRVYTLDRKSALTTLDWGRGVWEYSSYWNWASASGFLRDGRSVGLNLGTGFGDLSHATENCFFINGKMTKLDRVEFLYDSSNYMRQWFFPSNDGKLNLTFTPFLERVARSNLLVIRSEVHQMFGRYDGYVVTDAKEKIAVKGLIGWAEEHHARW